MNYVSGQYRHRTIGIGYKNTRYTERKRLARNGYVAGFQKNSVRIYLLTYNVTKLNFHNNDVQCST